MLASCEAKWSLGPENPGALQNCYKVFPGPIDVDTAVLECTAENAELSPIETNLETEFITNMVANL